MLKSFADKLTLAVLIVAALFAVFIWLAPGNKGVAISRPTHASATLRAAPGNRVVQMFDQLNDSPDVKVTTFADGLKCTKESDLLRYGNGDTAMFFYKLKCNGKVGYVNADWVR